MDIPQYEDVSVEGCFV